MTVALPLFGAFVLGLGARRWLIQHIAFLVRAQLSVGIGLLAVLAGWSFELSGGNLAAIGVLLAAQLTALGVATRVFRRRSDHALIAFWMFGNPTYWTAPIAVAALGAKAAVFVVAYDMLTQPRIALGIRLLRRHATVPQTRTTALADYAPTIGALAGLLLGRLVPAPDVVTTLVAGLAIAMSAMGVLLLGVSWPKRWIGRPQLALSFRVLALHLTLVPCALALATLAGIDLPGAVWLFALGPVPTSVVSFAQLYGYSPRTAATGLVMSVAAAIVLLPLAIALAH
ncbi:hypothetical protein OJ998_26115 [Solirubrobacter taibaiensis]|nr:hypothetical protein [Solirubrobacter taibaiensis]